MTAPAEFDRWLSPQQQLEWRAYLEGNAILWSFLNDDMEILADLSMGEYEILVRLSERDGFRMRMSELAHELSHSRSRISHTVRRLEKRKFVKRAPIQHDKRGVTCELTPTGYATLVQAAPLHVNSVRKRLVDVITDDELTTLAQIFRKVTKASSAYRLAPKSLASNGLDAGSLSHE